MSAQQSRILEADRQARFKLVKEQGYDAPRKSEWVISTLRSSLRPEDVATAHHLAGLYATAFGGAPMHDYVDGMCIPDRHMAAVMDATKALDGFVQAARTRVNDAAAKCTWAIACSDSLADTSRAMGFSQKAYRPTRRLVQITMIALTEYRDECDAAAKKWNAGT